METNHCFRMWLTTTCPKPFQLHPPRKMKLMMKMMKMMGMSHMQLLPNGWMRAWLVMMVVNNPRVNLLLHLQHRHLHLLQRLLPNVVSFARNLSLNVTWFYLKYVIYILPGTGQPLIWGLWLHPRLQDLVLDPVILFSQGSCKEKMLELKAKIAAKKAAIAEFLGERWVQHVHMGNVTLNQPFTCLKKKVLFIQ